MLLYQPFYFSTFLRMSETSPSSVMPHPTVTPVMPANILVDWLHGRHTGDTLTKLKINLKTILQISWHKKYNLKNYIP